MSVEMQTDLRGFARGTLALLQHTASFPPAAVLRVQRAQLVALPLKCVSDLTFLEPSTDLSAKHLVHTCDVLPQSSLAARS